MSVITGTAKKFDGSAIDYVSLFNWEDGSCLAQIIPIADGTWSYDYYTYLTLGITYVADGCEPVTHGSYRFKPDSIVVTKGFVVTTYLVSGSRAAPQLDVTNTSNPQWVDNFSQTKDFGFFNYLYTTTSSISAPLSKKQLQFDPRWTLEYTGFSDAANYLYQNIRFLDDDDELVFQLVLSSQVGSDTTNVQYGISSLTYAPKVGSSAVFPLGDLSFTDTQVLFTNKRASNYIGSFSFDVDVTRIKSMMVSFEASVNSENTESGAWLKILNRV